MNFDSSLYLVKTDAFNNALGVIASRSDLLHHERSCEYPDPCIIYKFTFRSFSIEFGVSEFDGEYKSLVMTEVVNLVFRKLGFKDCDLTQFTTYDKKDER